MAPEYFPTQRRAPEDDAPAVPAAPVLGQPEHKPIRVFLPAEMPLLPAADADSGAPPASGRMSAPSARSSGPRLVVEDDDDFDGEIIVAEGKAVG